MTYQSKNSKYQTDFRIYTTQLIFNTSEYVDLPNGLTVSRPVEKFKRWAAPYKATSSLIASLNGFDSRTDRVFAVRAIGNDPLSRLDFDQSMIVTINGYNKDDLSFDIQAITTAPNERNAYHLITLRQKK